jgi:hypothetical protein
VSIQGDAVVLPVNDSGWRHAGYVDGVEGWCERPSQMVNVHTGEHHLARCKSARTSRCAPCAEVKRNDVAAVGRSGWTDCPADRAYMVTLTAPGVDVLPWDRSLCTHSERLRCSGSDFGCQVEANALARWHDDIGIRVSRVFEDVRRALNPGESALPVSKRSIRFEYMRTYEPQKRGALHAHLMGRLEGPATDRRFRRAFKEAALKHGFGKELRIDQVDLSSPLGAARAAGYVAKYNSKSADALPEVRRIDAYGEIRYGGLRSWAASRSWGDTMAVVELRRVQWAVANAVATAGGAAANADGGAVGDALDLYQGCSATGVALVSVEGSSVLL